MSGLEAGPASNYVAEDAFVRPKAPPGEVRFYRNLTELGVAIFVARPDATSSKDEFVLPRWRQLAPSNNYKRLRWLQPKVGIGGTLSGHVAIVDVDTKNGADIDQVAEWLKEIGVTIYAEIETPSGGRHFYVAGHPDLPNVAAREGRDGLRDLPGVEILSVGRFAYLPGSSRPKYDDAGYKILSNHLRNLATQGDPESAEHLVQAVAERRVTAGAVEWLAQPSAPPWDGTAPDKRQAAYLATALAGEVNQLADMGEGGRNSTLCAAAIKMGSYIAGAGLAEDEVADALLGACGDNGLAADDGEGACRATIASGFRIGMANPRAVPEESSQKETTAQALVRIAKATYRFGQSLEGRSFAVRHKGPNLAREIAATGRSDFTSELSGLLYKESGKVPNAAALSDARSVLHSFAMESERETVALRVAQPDSHRIVIDVGDETGRAIEITPNGWTVLDRSPVPFKRTAFSCALPMPKPDGDFGRLSKLINTDAKHIDLLVAWLVAAFFAETPRPALMISGEYGSAKSSATDVCATLVDPSATGGKGTCTSQERWLDVASATYVVVLENVSTVPPWLSDAVCRAVTGEGTAKRGLYTDDTMHLAMFRRVVIINGIDVLGIKGDLGDRLLKLDLEPIDPRNRKEEAIMKQELEAARPELFGALLDVMVKVLAIRNAVPRRDELRELPRMADFARIVRAVDLVRGTDALATYIDSASSAKVELAVEHPLTKAIAEALAYLHLEQGPAIWEGTAAELFEEIGGSPMLTTSRRTTPSNPKTLASTLRTLAPDLREAGWQVDFRKSNGARRIRIGLPSSEGVGRTAYLREAGTQGSQ